MADSLVKLPNINRIREGSHGSGSNDLLELLVSFARRECYNPRDRVYSFLGLADDITRGMIRPDYTKTTAQVFEHATAQLIIQSGKPTALSLITRSRHPRDPDLPS